MLKRIALFLLVVWLPSGCAAAREEESPTKRTTQAAFCWPLQNFRYSRSTGGGWLAPRGRGSQHLGIDMFAPVGTPVRAIADGTVYDISTGGWGWGNVAVMVKHRLAAGRWFIALYGHIRNSQGLRKGSRVRACSTIGVVGSYSCGSHLHFGVIAPGRLPHAPYGTSKRGDHNNFIDPLQFLRSSQTVSTTETAARQPAAAVKTVIPAAGKAAAPDSVKKVGTIAEVAAQTPVLSAADDAVSVSLTKKQQSRRPVRHIRSKNKKRAAAASKKSRSKKRLKKQVAKKVITQKSKRSRSASTKGKVRSLTGNSKRAVSARKRR